MTSGKCQIMGGGEERETKLAENRKTEAGAKPAASNPWYRRVGLWRSVAGMALAIALGCVAVALETAAELSSRSTFYHRRLELLRGRISELRAEAAAAERQLATERAEEAVRISVNRVLSATDVVVLQLRPSPGTNARGMTAISKDAGSAIIEISGLAAAAGHSYLMWWQLAQRAPIQAAELRPDADGRLSLTARMPPTGTRIAGAIVTLEPATGVARPSGRVILRGELPIPQVVSFGNPVQTRSAR